MSRHKEKIMSSAFSYLFLSFLDDVKYLFMSWMYKKIDRVIVRLALWRGMKFQTYTLAEWAKGVSEGTINGVDINKRINKAIEDTWGGKNIILDGLGYKETKDKTYTYKNKHKKKDKK
jgi:hypothetical protein